MKILKLPSFYLGIILFAIITSFMIYDTKIFSCIDNNKMRICVKIFTIVILVVINIIIEKYKYWELSSSAKSKILKQLLSTIDQFKKFNHEQRLRSNIIFKNKKNILYIKYSYNMDSHQDKNIQIPDNLGCSGDAFRTGHQTFGDRSRIYDEGKFRVPPEELKKVPEDLEWICSTPIKINDKTIAVFNIDSNKILTDAQIDEIKKFSISFSDILKDTI